MFPGPASAHTGETENTAAVAPVPLPAELAEVAHRLTRLSPEQRAVVVLIRLSGLTYAEVARLIERPVNTVGRLLGEADRLLAADAYGVRATLESLSWRVPPWPRCASRPTELNGSPPSGGAAFGSSSSPQHWALRRRGGPATQALRPLHVRPAGEWTFGLQISPPPGWQINSHVVGVDRNPPADHPTETETSCQIRATLPATPQRSDPRHCPRRRTSRSTAGERTIRTTDRSVRGPLDLQPGGGGGRQLRPPQRPTRAHLADGPARPVRRSADTAPLRLAAAAGRRTSRLRRLLRGADPGGTGPRRRSTTKQRRPVSAARVPGQPTATTS